MKRRLLAMFIGICLLCMTGSAVAPASESTTIYLTLPTSDSQYDCGAVNASAMFADNIMIVQVDDTSHHVDASTKLTQIAINLTVSNSITKENITWLGSVPDDVKKIEYNKNYANFGTFTHIISLTTSGNTTIGPVRLEFDETIAWDKVAVHVQSLANPVGSDSIKLTEGECGGGGQQQEIPEFPTIALPVVAILGLALFFQRRKE